MDTNGIKRNEDGTFAPGWEGGPGRPADTEADKIRKKAIKELIAEYKQGLGEALPLIKPILIAKALDGDIPAIKEIHDRVMDKAKQVTDSKLEVTAPKPLLYVLDNNSNEKDSPTEQEN